MAKRNSMTPGIGVVGKILATAGIRSASNTPRPKRLDGVEWGEVVRYYLHVPCDSRFSRCLPRSGRSQFGLLSRVSRMPRTVVRVPTVRRDCSPYGV